MAVNEFDEFRKQYEKTHIRIKFEGGEKFIVMLVKGCIADDGDRPYLVLHNPPLGSCSVNWEGSRQNISYDFPKVGLFNHDKSFLMFHRFPDRQWKRGISAGNSHIADPLRDIKRSLPELTGKVPNGVPVEFNTLTSAFSESYPDSFDTAVNTLYGGEQLGVALSPMFGVTKNPASIEPWVLWKHLSMIGFVFPKERRIEIKEPTFQQEIDDFLKRKQERNWTLS